MLEELTKDVHELLLRSGYKISFAESCTGGLLQKLITDNSGSSSYFEGGFVVYSNRMKEKLLHVPSEILSHHGAVSSECALAMVSGLQRISQADMCISVTGIAGPTGGSAEKPVGTVWFGFNLEGNLETKLQIFSGSRQEIREKSAEYVLKKLKEYLTQKSK
jgi:PncC family amidohydrolase